jgi:hypothetical protein
MESSSSTDCKPSDGLLPRDTGSLLSLNHISFLARRVEVTKKFYINVMGFVEVKRPESFDFGGCWCVPTPLMLSSVAVARMLATSAYVLRILCIECF